MGVVELPDMFGRQCFVSNAMVFNLCRIVLNAYLVSAGFDEFR